MIKYAVLLTCLVGLSAAHVTLNPLNEATILWKDPLVNSMDRGQLKESVVREDDLIRKMSLVDLQRQKFLLDVLANKDVDLAGKVGRIDSFDARLYETDMDIRILQKTYEMLLSNMLLSKDQDFDILNEDHSQQLLAVYHLLVGSREFETFQRNVVLLRSLANKALFVNALVLAVRDRPDTQALIVPALNEILPEIYYNGEVLQGVRSLEADLLRLDTKGSLKSSLLDIIGLGRATKQLGRTLSLNSSDRSRLWMPWRDMRLNIASRKDIDGRPLVAIQKEKRIILPIARNQRPTGSLVDDIDFKAFVQSVITDLALQSERAQLLKKQTLNGNVNENRQKDALLNENWNIRMNERQSELPSWDESRLPQVGRRRLVNKVWGSDDSGEVRDYSKDPLARVRLDKDNVSGLRRLPFRTVDSRSDSLLGFNRRRIDKDSEELRDLIDNNEKQIVGNEKYGDDLSDNVNYQNNLRRPMYKDSSDRDYMRKSQMVSLQDVDARSDTLLGGNRRRIDEDSDELRDIIADEVNRVVNKRSDLSNDRLMNNYVLARFNLKDNIDQDLDVRRRLNSARTVDPRSDTLLGANRQRKDDESEELRDLIKENEDYVSNQRLSEQDRLRFADEKYLLRDNNVDSSEMVRDWARNGNIYRSDRRRIAEEQQNWWDGRNKLDELRGDQVNRKWMSRDRVRNNQAQRADDLDRNGIVRNERNQLNRNENIDERQRYIDISDVGRLEDYKLAQRYPSYRNERQGCQERKSDEAFINSRLKVRLDRNGIDRSASDIPRPFYSDFDSGEQSRIKYESNRGMEDVGTVRENGRYRNKKEWQQVYEDEENRRLDSGHRRRVPRSLSSVVRDNGDLLKELKGGEIILHNLQQLLARINMERFSSGLGGIEIQMEDNGLINRPDLPQDQRFALRLNAMRQKNMVNRGILNRIKDIEGNLKAVLDKSLNSLPVNIDKAIADLLMGGVGNENILSALRGVMAERSDSLKIQKLGVILDDPVIQYLLRRIVRIADEKREKIVGPYRRDEIEQDGIKISYVEIDRLQTYDDWSDSDLVNLLDSQLDLLEQGSQKYVGVRQPRLNHKPFNIDVEVRANEPQRVVVRAFLGPRVDLLGNEMNLDDIRRDFMLLDAVVVDLQVGKNIVRCNSNDIIWTSRDTSSYSEIYQRVMSSLKGEYQKRPISLRGSDNVGQMCRFPQHLLLPRGRVDGLPMQMLIIVNKIAQSDQLLNKMKLEEGRMCGIGIGSSLVDSRPLGYPLDRRLENVDEFIGLPNVQMVDVTIYHDSK